MEKLEETRVNSRKIDEMKLLEKEIQDLSMWNIDLRREFQEIMEHLEQRIAL